MERTDKDSNREFYDTHRDDDRQRFELEPSKRFWSDELVRWIVPRLRPGDRVLDVAGGSGVYASQIVRAAPVSVVGLDISESMIRQRAQDPQLPFNVVGDMESLPFKPESFDAVLFVACLHHVPDPLTALREAFRVLRPGGRLFAVEPCSLRARRTGAEPVPGHPHEFRFSLGFVTGRIREAGFELEEVTGKQVAMRLIDRAFPRPSLRVFRAADAIDRALAFLPGIAQLGETAELRAAKPGPAGPTGQPNSDPAGLLACPRCFGELTPGDASVTCRDCGAVYPVDSGVKIFLSEPSQDDLPVV